MPSIIRSFGESELLIGLIEAFGGARPSSNGPGELLWALIQAIEGFNPGGTISLIQNTDGTLTISGGVGPTVTISRAATTGDVIIASGSNVATLQNTANVESIIRNIAPNTQQALSGAINANGNKAFTDSAAGTVLGDPVIFGQPGTLIGATYFEPSGATNKTTTSGSLVAIDTTDLTVPFTATTTVAVVELEAFVGFLAGTSAGQVSWGLFTSGTSTQVGYTTGAIQVADNSHLTRVRAIIRVTGLTIGTSYQYDWAWAVGGSGDTALMLIQATTGTSGAGGPAVMRVLAG
jgi:hypothetical protein